MKRWWFLFFAHENVILVRFVRSRNVVSVHKNRSILMNKEPNLCCCLQYDWRSVTAVNAWKFLFIVIKNDVEILVPMANTYNIIQNSGENPRSFGLRNRVHDNTKKKMPLNGKGITKTSSTNILCYDKRIISA